MAQINGTPNDDILQGGGGNDDIHGGDGNDTVFANGGDDEVFGEGGNDYLVGGIGADTLWGGEGQDELMGLDGNDVLRGENGADKLTGGQGNDDLQGGDGADTLYGDNGDPYSYSGDGADSLDGGAGNDLIYGGGGNDMLLGGADFDQLTGGAGNDLIDGGDGDDFINGTGSEVFGAGESDIDTLIGGSGDDRINAGYGDSVDGGTGTDIMSLDYYFGLAGVTADFRQLANNGTITIAGANITNIEYIGRYSLTQFDDTIIAGARPAGGSLEISGWGGNDDLTGTSGVDNIYGGDGDDIIRGNGGYDPSFVPSGDRLRGEAGNDIIYVGNDLAEASGGTGDDKIYGGNGADSIYGDDGADILFGGAGADGILGGSGDDRVIGGAGADYLQGGDGIDTLDYSQEGGALGVYVNLQFGGMPGPGPQGFVPAQSALDSYGNLDSIGQFENVVTGSGNDSVYGNGFANRIETGAGDDVLEGGGGDDVLIGGTGNDTYWFETRDFSGAPTGTIVELAGGGIDEVATTFASFSIAGIAQVENLTGYNNAGGTLTGNGLDNAITGAAGADSIFGGAGNDTLKGGAGNDTLEGEDGDDVLDGGAGDDIVRGGPGNDMLIVSGTGTDTADGGAGGWDRLVVDYGDSVDAITMTVPSADPNGGFSGSISGAGRSLGYSSIELFTVTTGSGNDSVRGGGSTNGAPGIQSNIYNLGAGDDIFYGMGGTDTVDAGSGVDGFSGTIAGYGTFWSLQPTTFPGTHDYYTNFEYFLSLTTGSGQDNITTANLNLDDNIWLGDNGDTAILWNGHDYVNGGAAGSEAVDGGLDTLALNYGQATTAVHNVGALSGNAAGYSGQFGDDSTRLATFAAIDRFLIATGSGADNIVTGSGNDQIRTGSNSDIIDSGGGNDLLDGGSGDDVMTGGTGNDLYFVDSAGDVVNENGGEGIDEVRTGLATYVLAANIENLTATSNIAHDLRGNSGNNVITGGGGNDFIRAYDGGDDTILAGAGQDNIFMGGSLNGADIVNGGADADTLILQGNYAGGLVLSANVTQIEGISILGGGNTNFGDPGTNLYDYVITTNDANFAAGLQVRVNGAALLAGEDFTFDGSAETDAKFVVYGGRGVDKLTGGLGNDIFFFAEDRFATGDVVNGGPGYDGMFLRGNYTIDFNAPGYTGLFTSIENLTLTSATDERYARGGGTEFDYNITLSDAIVKAGETLTVSGTILMASETMILDASQESDGLLRLFGGKADDTLKGGGQADLIHGNLGADILAGNGGADTFRYDYITESNSATLDHILDFTAGIDKLDLTRVDADSLTAGDQAFSWIGSNAFSHTAGELRAFQSGGDWFVEGDVNGDGVGDLVIQLTVQGPTPLGAGDFLL